MVGDKYSAIMRHTNISALGNETLTPPTLLQGGGSVKLTLS